MKKLIAIGSLLTLLSLLSGCALSNSGVKLANATNEWSTLGIAPAIDQARGDGWFREDFGPEKTPRYEFIAFRVPIGILHGLCTWNSIYTSYVPFTPAWFISIATGSEFDCWAEKNAVSGGIFYHGGLASALLPSCDHSDSWERRDGKCTKRGKDRFARKDRLKIFDAKLELAEARRRCRKTAECTDVYVAEQKVRRMEKRALETLVAGR